MGVKGALVLINWFTFSNWNHYFWIVLRLMIDADAIR